MGVTPFPILNSTPLPRSHEHFSRAAELEQALRRTLRGEVRFDAGSRALYATDASNYRQLPIGLVIPRDQQDLINALALCRDHGAPVLARGGGTSLAGQCCNVAVVFDLSKYLRNILSLDPSACTARVEPGIVLDRVREAAEQHGLTFAPDPATHNRCTLGGMIGNNSCGVHALMGGKTVDNIRSLDVLLYDGTRLTVGATPDDQLRAILAGRDRRAEIYRSLLQIRDRYQQQIRSRFPRIPRRVSGYNLDELLPENHFHVARALVGSEGTCVTVLSAELELMPSPPHRVLVVLGYPDPFCAADAVPSILRHKPIGLEGFDGMLVDFMRRKHLAVDDLSLLPEGRGHLLVEFGADSLDEAHRRAQALAREASQAAGQDANIYSGADAARVWHVREAALGATVFVPGEPHGWEGWEDAAVPPAALGSYLREIYALMQRYGYRTPMYGHFGQGCVHMRINFDLESEPGIATYRAFIDQAADIVLAHGGSLSGEHGDGQSRAALLPKMFGPDLMQAFREFKAVWDPLNRMNPGKLADPVEVYQPTQNLRLGPGYRASSPPTYFSFAQDKGSFGEATLRCVGVGACRKETTGTMCPSYMATREEKHSTRGRAHLLWEMLENKGLSGGFDSEAVHDALNLCLSCKACKSECPVSVDMATYKAEFLAHYHRSHRHALRDYAFAFMDRSARAASLLPGITPRLANLPLRTPLVSSLIKRALGVAPQRTLPAFAPRSFQSRLPASGGTGRQVLLWPDTWNNYYHPNTLAAAHRLLCQAGLRPYVPRKHVCCGRPLYDFGFLDQARTYLARILSRFASQIDNGTPFIFLEPSCASVFRDELLNFFPHDARAQRLAASTLLLSQALVQLAPSFVPAPQPGRQILVHGHCHHKSLMKMQDELTLLRGTGAEVTLLDSGCCGMAGPFGFEREKYEVSQALGSRVLLPAVRAAQNETVIVTDGFSCREQIAQNTSRRAVHLAEALLDGS